MVVGFGVGLFVGDFRVKFGVLFLGGLRWRAFVVDFWSGKLALGLVVDFGEKVKYRMNDDLSPRLSDTDDDDDDDDSSFHGKHSQGGGGSSGSRNPPEPPRGPGGHVMPAKFF